MCPDHINALKRADWTPLMMAVAKPHSIEICKILLENGADVKLVNKDGWTPLHISARTGDHDTFFTLLSTAPELLEKFSKNGRSIMNTLCLHGHHKIFSKLFDLYPKLCSHLARDRLIFHDIARSKSPEILNIFAKLSQYFRPADWLVSDRAGFTPLHAAAQVRDNQTHNKITYFFCISGRSSGKFQKYFKNCWRETSGCADGNFKNVIATFGV